MLSACTRCQAGLSIEAARLEWTSFDGPRPHFSPLETSLQLDDSLGAEVHLDRAVGRLAAQRDDDADALAERRFHLGLEHDLPEVGRADLLLALGDQHEVDRQLPSERP